MDGYPGGHSEAILLLITQNGSSAWKKCHFVTIEINICDTVRNVVCNMLLIFEVSFPHSINILDQYNIACVLRPIDEQVNSTTPDIQFRWSVLDQQWEFYLS